jgi:SH3-like domain-containing protein
VKPGDPRPVRTRPDDNAKIRYLAQHGVVGRIDKCKGDGWCRIEIGKDQGYIRTSDVWGVGDSEVLD